ncbi:MAG: tetratricopeptide repeat protein [Candidatus Omnitrophota bacterium]|jgi:tetratricopeptide (TPR) repeat protein
MLRKIGLLIALAFISSATTIIYHKTQQPDINYYQGSRLFQQGLYKDANVFYKKTLALNPSHLKALKDSAYCYQWTGEHKQAKEAFKYLIGESMRHKTIVAGLIEAVKRDKKDAFYAGLSWIPEPDA